MSKRKEKIQAQRAQKARINKEIQKFKKNNRNSGKNKEEENSTIFDDSNMTSLLKDIEQEQEKENKKGFLFFIRNHKVGVSLGTAAAVLLSSVGLYAFLSSGEKNKDKDTDVSEDPTTSVTIDPTYDPTDTPSHTVSLAPTESLDVDSTESIIIDPSSNPSIGIWRPWFPSKPVTTVAPSESCGEHTFGDWTKFDNLLESRTCSVCGTVEYRDHTITNTKTYKNIKHGQHEVHSVVMCSTCDFQGELTFTEDCSYGKMTYDSKYEYKTCTGCKDQIKTSHKMVNGKCVNEGCGYSITVHESSEVTDDPIYTYDPEESSAPIYSSNPTESQPVVTDPGASSSPDATPMPSSPDATPEPSRNTGSSTGENGENPDVVISSNPQESAPIIIDTPTSEPSSPPWIDVPSSQAPVSTPAPVESQGTGVPPWIDANSSAAPVNTQSSGEANVIIDTAENGEVPSYIDTKKNSEKESTKSLDGVQSRLNVLYDLKKRLSLVCRYKEPEKGKKF